MPVTTPETIKFEHLDSPNDGNGSAAIAHGYDGFDWTNVNAYDNRNPNSGGPGSGYDNAVVTGHGAAFNTSAQDATFSSATTFTLKTGYFTGAFGSESVTVTAFVNGHQKGQIIFGVNNSTPTLVDFRHHHFNHIDSVTISTGGISFSQVAFDNLRVVFDGAIPGATDVHEHGATDEARAGHHAAFLEHFAPHVDVPMDVFLA